ncbi:MAG TPA: hypothetical protein PLW42_12295 [Anaerohalosphaeraceae bacterium]|nr:hypothetical protein [Anaerohalosphaeraceae bacterium]
MSRRIMMPFKRVMPVERGVTQSRWDYVNVRGFGAGTAVLALRLPGVYALPSGSWRGTDQHGELAVVEQAQRAEQPTAGRDLLFLMREARRGTAASL